MEATLSCGDGACESLDYAARYRTSAHGNTRAHGDETARASVALDGRPSIEEPHRARTPLASASCTASDAVSQVRQAARGIVTAHRVLS